jgi:thiosulfate dehydrogenase
MPQSSPGSLTAQQAFDVAAYVHSQPRPKLDPANSKY